MITHAGHKLVTNFNDVRDVHVRCLLVNDKFVEAKVYVEGMFAGITAVHDEHTAAAKVLDAVGPDNHELFPKKFIRLLVDSYLTQ